MVWLFLFLNAGAALADEPPPVPSSPPEEPAFCTDPFAAICEPTEKVLPDFSQTREQLDELRNKRGHPEKVRPAFARFQEMEKQSVVPLLDETRARLLDSITGASDLTEEDRA